MAGGKRVRTALALLATAAMTAIASPASASDFSSSQILGAFNAERSANGLPGPVTEVPDWSYGCYLHDQYGVLNNGWDSANPHGETTTNPGYTSQGALAGGSAVLATGAAWAGGNPWEDAPWHFLQMMHPLMALSGADEHGGFDCLWAADSSGPVPGADTLFGALPGGHDAATWWEQVHNEWPSSPGDLVGYPQGSQPGQGSITGPDIAVYWTGPVTQTQPSLDELTAATVTGPGGPVPVSIVSDQTSPLAWPTMGIVLPHDPLLPDTTYTVSATFASASDATAAPFTGSFSFHTAPQVDAAQLVHIGDLVTAGATASVDLSFDPPLEYRSGTVTVSSNYGPSGSMPGTELAAMSFYGFPPPGPGQWLTFTVDTPAFSVGSTSYPARTVSRTFAGPPATAGTGSGGSGVTGSGAGATGSGSGATGSGSGATGSGTLAATTSVGAATSTAPAGRGTTPPRVSLSAPLAVRLRALLTSGLRARVGCSEACSIGATLTLDRKGTRPRVVGTASGSLTAAGSTTLVVHVGRAARRALARPHGVVLALHLAVSDLAGNAAAVPDRRIGVHGAARSAAAAVAVTAAARHRPTPGVRVAVSKGRITVTGTVAQPVAGPPLSIMVFDAAGLSAGLTKHCDAKPGRDGRMPWVVHSTTAMMGPGDYSVQFLWVAHRRPVTRTEYFAVPRARR